LFRDGLRDVDIARILSSVLPALESNRPLVVGAGKAAARMAEAVQASESDEAYGAVIVPDGYGLNLGNIEVFEASHPVPDGRGQAATAKLCELIATSSADETIIGLWSGGASALMTAPVEGLELDGKISITSSLLQSGAPIQDINTVRKHLSTVKGGKLALAAGARPMFNFIVSDVVGDDLSVIGSGPTVPDPTTSQDAVRILERHKIKVPVMALDALRQGVYETPNTLPPNVHNRLVLSPSDLLAAVERRAEDAGYAVINLGDSIEGESRDVGAVMAKKALGYTESLNSQPILVLSGGETTVTLDEKGVGGPNLEFALALAIALQGAPGIWALAADSDGRDGVSGVAGAFVDAQTLSRAQSKGVDVHACLESHNSKRVFAASKDLFDPGPTGTNLNDIRMIAIHPSP